MFYYTYTSLEFLVGLPFFNLHCKPVGVFHNSDCNQVSIMIFFLFYPDQKTMTLFLDPEQMAYMCILDESLYRI